MEKLTDLEICTRIAEIEGLDLSGFSTHVMPDGSFYTRASNGAGRNINYLTDKALCFDLIFKYQVSIEPQPFNVTYAHIHCEHAVWGKNPQRAICLAIIKKNDKQ